MSVELRLLDWNGEELRSKGYKPVRLDVIELEHNEIDGFTRVAR